MDKLEHTLDASILDRAPQLLLASIDERWDKYRAARNRCRDEFPSDAVRSLRIATRRMLALVQLLRALNPRQRLQPLRRVFKDQLDSFDALRDTQVMLADISVTSQEMLALQPFREYLQRREERLLLAVRKQFKKSKPGNAARHIVRRRETLDDGVSMSIPVRLLQAIDESFLLTQQRLGWVNSSDTTTIHSVRLAFKTFRYMVEMIHPALEGFPHDDLKRMKDYQGAMGAIQDIEILLRTLKEFASSECGFDPKSALRLYEQRHADAIAAYIEDMRELNTYWRAAPDQPFPWETLQ